MPIWLIRLLPYAAGALALAGVALWLDHRGYARAELEAENARLEREQLATAIVNEIGRQLDADLAELERKTNGAIAEINKEDRTVVQPIIQREISRDPSLLSRVCLTPELLRAINIGRGAYVGAGDETKDQRTGKAGVPGSAGDH